MKHLVRFFIFIFAISIFNITQAQDTSGILTPDPNAPVTPNETKINWSACEAEINKHCPDIVAEEAEEKVKANEPAKKDDGFKPIEAKDEAKGDSPTTPLFTDKLKKVLPPQRDIAKHDCLSKVVITDFSRECLTQYRSLCSKFNKTCGRRKKMKKN